MQCSLFTSSPATFSVHPPLCTWNTLATPPEAVSRLVAWQIAFLPSQTASSKLMSYRQKVSKTPQAQVMPEPTLNRCPLILLPSVLIQYRLGPLSSTPESMRPICSPYLLQWLIKFTIMREAAATVGSLPCFSSRCRTCCDSHASQYWQSAAPPAIVASFLSLISITFLTFSDEMKFPMVALESTAMMIPSLKTKAKVVVPVLKSMILLSSVFEFLTCSQNSQGRSIGGSARQFSNSSKSHSECLSNSLTRSGQNPPKTQLYILKIFQISKHFTDQLLKIIISFISPLTFSNYGADHPLLPNSFLSQLQSQTISQLDSSSPLPLPLLLLPLLLLQLSSPIY